MGAGALMGTITLAARPPHGVHTSSHREATPITTDPPVHNTDVCAFLSSDEPGTVTLIANFMPFEEPAGGPNFYEFDDMVLHENHVDINASYPNGRRVGDDVWDLTLQVVAGVAAPRAT